MVSYLRPVPWYINYPVSVVLFGIFWTLLIGYTPPKHPGIDWNPVWFASGIGLLSAIARLPFDYLYNKWRAERNGNAAR